MDYALHSLALLLLRSLDLLTTWRISPDLKREINPIYRLAGWRITIVLNLCLCASAYHWPRFYWACVAVTLFVIAWNTCILIVQPALRKDVIEQLKKTKFRKRRMRWKLAPLKKSVDGR